MNQIDNIYPVGYIYETTDSAFNPSASKAFSACEWSALNDAAANMANTTYGSYVGANAVTLTTTQMQGHNHTGTIASTKPGNSTGTYLNTKITRIWNRLDTVAGTTSYGQGTTTFSSLGGGSAHNNMQPYYVVYKWLRTL